MQEAISNSLADYNQHIEALKADMEDASESAKALRSDIQETRNKSVHLHLSLTCVQG